MVLPQAQHILPRSGNKAGREQRVLAREEEMNRKKSPKLLTSGFSEEQRAGAAGLPELSRNPGHAGLYSSNVVFRRIVYYALKAMRAGNPRTWLANYGVCLAYPPFKIITPLLLLLII